MGVGKTLIAAGVALVMIALAVYGIPAIQDKLDPVFMYYTLVTIGAALIIGGYADIRFDTIESKIDEFRRKMDDKK